jgi:hypothetical protein
MSTGSRRHRLVPWLRTLAFITVVLLGIALVDGIVTGRWGDSMGVLVGVALAWLLLPIAERWRQRHHPL